MIKCEKCGNTEKTSSGLCSYCVWKGDAGAGLLLKEIIAEEEKSMLMNCFTGQGELTIMVERISWDDVKVDDLVFIGGNLKNGEPTKIYGPHYVVDIEKRVLKNRHGAFFNERLEYLFRGIENGTDRKGENEG